MIATHSPTRQRSVRVAGLDVPQTSIEHAEHVQPETGQTRHHAKARDTSLRWYDDVGQPLRAFAASREEFLSFGLTRSREGTKVGSLDGSF